MGLASGLPFGRASTKTVVMNVLHFKRSLMSNISPIQIRRIWCKGKDAQGRKISMTLNATQQELQTRARKLAREIIAPRAAEVDRSEQYPWDNVETLKNAGFFGMTIPKQYGGQGFGFLEACLVVDEVAQVCGVTGRIVVEANMGAISAVMHYGSEAQKKLAAEMVLSGDKPAICITEPAAGSAASEMTTRADRRGKGYVINGAKHWITGAGVSRLHLVFARVFDEAGEE